MKLEVYNIKGESIGREVELSSDVFGLELNEKHDHVVYLAVKQYLNAQRQGTHKSKERNEIKGSTKKIKRQKGTGTARAGSMKNPLFRGGGRVFGPRPRNYAIQLNKKVRKLARKAVLTNKFNEGAIQIVEDFSFDSPRTKEYKSFLDNLSAEGKDLTSAKSLLVLDAPLVDKEPMKPAFPRKLRGAKNRAKYKSQVEQYVADLNDYKESKRSYYETVDASIENAEKLYDNIVLSSRNLKNAEVVDAKNVNIFELMNADYILMSEGALNQLTDILS